MFILLIKVDNNTRKRTTLIAKQASKVAKKKWQVNNSIGHESRGGDPQNKGTWNTI